MMPSASASALRVKSLLPAWLCRSVPGCRLIGVGQDEDPEPLVRRANFCRREQARRRRVAHAPKLSQDGFKAKGDVTGHVFEKDPFGGTLPDDAGDVRPEVARIVGPAAFSGGTERLAGISGEDDVEGTAEGAGIETAQIVPDWGRGEISGALGGDEDGSGVGLPFNEGAGVKPGSASTTPKSRPPPPAQRGNPCRGRDTMPFTAPPAHAAVPA